MESYPLDRMTPGSRCLERSCYKQKPLYIYYHSAYDHQTMQDGDLSLGIRTIEFR